MIKDKIVFSVKEKPLKGRLLREAKLTLKNAETMCLSSEVTQNELKSMAAESSKSTAVHGAKTHKPSQYQNKIKQK